MSNKTNGLLFCVLGAVALAIVIVFGATNDVMRGDPTRSLNVPGLFFIVCAIGAGGTFIHGLELYYWDTNGPQANDANKTAEEPKLEDKVTHCKCGVLRLSGAIFCHQCGDRFSI